jgi:hypothetical protein
LNPRAALAKDWRRWIRFIETAAARGRSSHRHIDRREYEAVHRRLTTVSRERAGSNDEDTKRVYREIEATVQPWMSPQALEQADREILSDLLERCRRIEHELTGRGRAPRRDARWALLLIAASSTAFVVLWSVRLDWSKLADALYDETRDLWTMFRRMGDLEKLFALGVVLTVLSIYNVSRTARG